MKPPLKWLSQEAYDRMPTGEKALCWYRSWIGETEDQGSNRSKLINWMGSLISKYLATGSEPYCAETLNASLRQSGVSSASLPVNPAAVFNWQKWAAAHGRKTSEPKRGRAFYWLGANGKGHIGIIAEVLPGKVRTLEGNTGPDPTTPAKDRDGDGFYERVRKLKDIQAHYQWGFIDLDNL